MSLRGRNALVLTVLALIGVGVAVIGWVLRLRGFECRGVEMMAAGESAAAVLLFFAGRAALHLEGAVRWGGRVQMWSGILLLVILALDHLHPAIACVR